MCVASLGNIQSKTRQTSVFVVGFLFGGGWRLFVALEPLVGCWNKGHERDGRVGLVATVSCSHVHWSLFQGLGVCVRVLGGETRVVLR